MKKELMIEGMMCQNCVKHVTHALEGISGASHVQVSLEDKKATVEVPESVTDETLKAKLPRRATKSQRLSPMKADKAHITRSIKIARGQLDGILRMIEEDRYCVDISNQLLATQALLKRVNQEILRAHIRGCVREGLHTDEPNPKLEEALQLLEKLVT